MDVLKDLTQIVSEVSEERIMHVVPCGNHDLKRNYVYKVALETKQIIIKFFYKPFKSTRELETVPLFESGNHLKLLGYGKSKEGYDWIAYNYLEGVLLDQLLPNVSDITQSKLFEQIGVKTALLHHVKAYHYFGDWIAWKQSDLDAYASFMIQDTERMIYNLKMQGLERNPVVEAAINIVRMEYKNIRTLSVGRLCHRDLDGRNILVDLTNEHVHFLDFEKCVVFNHYFDIVGFYRRYFLASPHLLKSFMSGYETIAKIDGDFNKELRFNLYRIGIDICSWARYVSDQYFIETLAYLKDLLEKDSTLHLWGYK